MKVILLSRVSTLSQDLTQQTDLLVKAAHDKGYTDDQIILIEDKESAIKLSFEEREGIKDLLDAIDDNAVDRVIVYEISRIARRPDVFYKVRDILIKNHIQLQVLTPSFEMLKADGTLDENSNLLIGIFLSMAESEMSIKKERFARGKAKAKSEGRWIGGSVPFGYALKDKRIIVADEAGIVRRIFRMYMEPQHTAGTIAEELRSEGVINHERLYYSTMFVLRILKNEKYLGNNIYPPIIDKDIWMAVKEKRDGYKFNNRNTPDSSHCLSKGIYRTEDNRYGYICRATVNKYEVTVLKYGIKIDFADSIAWELTKSFNQTHNINEDIEARVERQIQMIHRKKYTAYKNIDIEKEKLERLEERYIEGHISKEKLNQYESKIKSNIITIEKSLRALEEELASNYSILSSTIIEDMDNMSTSDKIDLIHKTIKCINIERIKKYNLIFHVHYSNGEYERYKVNTFKKTKERI